MAKKSQIRESARAGLDALMKVGQAPDEKTAARHLQEALEHITQAAHGVSLREHALGRGKKPKGSAAGEDARLREAVAYATGDSLVNPLRGSGLLEQVLGPDARDDLGA